MVAVDLQSLVGRLNPVCRRTLEASVGLTLSRTHYNCEIEHWLLKLLEPADGDLAAILRVYEVDAGRLMADLTRVLDKLKTGNGRAPSLSPNLVKMVREAWVLASLQYGEGKVRSGHLLAALLSDETLQTLARDMSAQFSRITPDALRRDLPKIVADSAEAQTSAPVDQGSGAGGGPAAGGAPRAGGPTPNLDQYTIDLTARAKAGKIDPVLGRDGEIRQIIDILTRRRQNNPILTGEAGVGKTAVVEGFAIHIAAGDVPPDLRNVRLMSLDLGLLQAGAGMKGEFENRLKGVIEEVKSSAQPIIMFIDEAHTLIGAGGQAGQNDAANLLKPALARGEMRTIAATTWAEYKKYFEKDPALTRRFQVVKVEEPSEKVAVDMMRGLTETLEKHHKVRIVTEGLVEAVRLSHRYIPARQLPDKAVSLLDTACARVSMSQNATPAAIEDRRRTLQLTQTEIDILERELAVGIDHSDQIRVLKERMESVGAELAALEARWGRESELVKAANEAREAILDLHAKARAEGKPGADEAALAPLQATLAEKVAALKAEQGEDPLVKPEVDGQAIAEVVAAWTGIPVGRMVSNEIKTILTLKDRMLGRIIGQDHALEAIAQAMWTSRAKLTDPRKPIGVFLMVGTSGVGKTETALTLADLIYGGEQNVTTINMTEFKEEHKVSLLLGSPPGYVGYGEGGVLTEAVRRKPYSVVLLDELEKAHAGVQDIFFQVFDKGTIKDGEGRDIDFKNTVIIMTSNAGTDLIHRLCADPETMPDAGGLLEALRPELLKSFKPAFLGRTTIVPYFPLSDENIKKIVVLQINRIRKRLVDNYKAEFSYSPELVDSIAKRCHEVESGARNIENILSRTLLPELSARILARMAEGEGIGRVHVSVDAEDAFTYELG
ncbi:type VI secretion system ATPase TssH [Azospirillum sp. RWY-5-1]|uniref:Type VI secretion system ATPase TssH n=1 Tax=Azospirillum oleiclasticum TaxID=2735135 RepID=A0ABX2TKQ3_9PROT|nr:type VI secretion system ATPase TssH [Azospirillum oleiclasticum]NYZ17587.1 type VI secretion system ATPase TssH [Azospirillum oleiclasticum]NYZ24945.1 type VI secretion system ATPase TssH [Azospirillum oleiclasticum]